MSLLSYFATHCKRIPCFIHVKFLQTQYSGELFDDCINKGRRGVSSACTVANLKLTNFDNVLAPKSSTGLHFLYICSKLKHSLTRHVYSSSCSLNPIMSRRNKNRQNNEAEASSSNMRQELQPQERSKNLQPLLKIPKRINLVVVGTGGPGTSQSLLVTTEYTRYLFNCGEGTQRFLMTSKSLRTAVYAKLKGLEHVFITHKSWENTGGLLGMAMTLEGQKNSESKIYFNRNSSARESHSQENPEMTVHGPPGVENIALMAKKFAVQANMNIVKHEGVFKDSALTITPILIYSSDPGSSSYGLNPDSGSPGPAKRQKTESDLSSDVAYAYICSARAVPPKINVAKCIEAGITMGPMVGCLQRGESVTLADGRVVHPEQVTDIPESDDRPFLIIECPRREFLPSLLNCKDLQPYLGKGDKKLAIIVHMTPAQVFNMAEYQEWIKRFHDGTNHLVMNREASEISLPSVWDHQARLNIVSQDVFPLLPEIEDPMCSIAKPVPGKANRDVSSNRSSETSIEPGQGQIVKAFTGLHYVYRSKDGVGFQVEKDEFNCQEIQKEYLSLPNVQSDLAALREVVPSSSDGATVDSDEECLTSYPKITFLGTGSSESNTIRSQSCILVQISKHSAIILDCGEDSYGQLYRFFGKAKAKRIIRKVKAIFISHMHADHHLGLFALLKERKTAFDEKNEPFTPTFVNAPIQMKRWLRFYHTQLENVTDLLRFVRHQQSVQDYFGSFDDLSMNTATFKDIMEELNFTEYEPIEVEHCPNAYGLVFTHANGFKLVYSGDTRPCERLVKAGENCDVLIHEATHEDLLQGNAMITKHSTFSEAIDVGTRMKAKNIILTHFSQRYPYMLPLNGMRLPPNVSVAFDNMQISPRTMRHLPHMIPALLSLFALELQKYRDKNIRRLNKEAEAKGEIASTDSV